MEAHSTQDPTPQIFFAFVSPYREPYITPFSLIYDILKNNQVYKHKHYISLTLVFPPNRSANYHFLQDVLFTFEKVLKIPSSSTIPSSGWSRKINTTSYPTLSKIKMVIWENTSDACKEVISSHAQS